MEPAPGWLAAHVRHHQQVRNSIVGGAQVEPVSDRDDDFKQYRAWKRRFWVQSLLEWGPKPQAKNILHLSGSNCSVARDLFFTLSGFDPRIRDGEDYDFAFRAMHAGIPVYYLPNAFAWHHDPIDLRQFIKRNRQYYAAGSTLMRLAPGYYKDHFSKRAKDIHSGKRFFYRMFCFPASLLLMESSWFGILPRKVRFKCYDWLVTANAAYFPHLLDL